MASSLFGPLASTRGGLDPNARVERDNPYGIGEDRVDVEFLHRGTIDHEFRQAHEGTGNGGEKLAGGWSR